MLPPPLPAVFAANPWFASLPPALARTLLATAQPVRRRRGEFVFQQGDRVEGGVGAFFGLLAGQLKMSMLDADGGESILVLIEPGNWFGEVPVLEGQPRALSAVALRDCELLQLDATTFLALMAQPNGFAQAIARLLAGRLRMAYGFLGMGALRSMRARIAMRLLQLAHGDLTQADQGRVLLSTSQDALALMLGISRPSLNKELQVFAAAGVLALRYGGIEILDRQRLAAVAEGQPMQPVQLSDC